MSLPEWYIEWVERVSNIVSFKFPFKGTNAETRYLDWLADNVNPKRKRWFAIAPQDYMDEACSVWTFIHLQMEKYSLWKRLQKSKPLYKIHEREIDHWVKFIDKLTEKYPDAKWLPEQVVRDKDNRYQWTIDLIRVDEKNKTVYLYDWKTFWIAKKKWNLPDEYKKHTHKLKKLALQLSLYAETYRQKGYKIGWIYWVCLHRTWCYEYELDLYTTDEIDALLALFSLSQADKDIEFKQITDMIIELRKPTEQYGYCNVTIDMYKETDWKTAYEKIDEAKQAIAYITNKI